MKSAARDEGTIGIRYVIGRSLCALSVAAVIAFAQPVRADGAPAPSADALGTIEALLSYCSKIDAGSAAGYQQQLNLFVKGADEKVVTEVRESDEYRDAYQRTADLLSAVNADEARQTCSKSLVGGR